MTALSIAQLAELTQRFGPRWLLYRAGLAMRRRLGWLERLAPAKPWHDWPVPSRVELAPFFFEPGRSPSAAPDPALEAEARALSQGEFLLFGSQLVRLGLPPDWHRDPFLGRARASAEHWSRLADLDPQAGDIKHVWEPSRFRWVFVLARMHAATGESRWGELFWDLWESWRSANPPNSGPNWMCGQEAAIRLLGLGYALHAFHGHPSSTTERMLSLHSAIAVHAARIEANLDYALSQNNNHGIGEAAGLLTAGLLCPWHPCATVWRNRGWTLLGEQVMRQFYPDGAYIQHSFSYHRLALEYLLWSLELGRRHGLDFDRPVLDRLGAATRFLRAVVDPDSGGAPLYGSCDGASLFSLGAGAIDDYRPIVQAMTRVMDEAPAYPSGSWDTCPPWRTPEEAPALADTGRPALEARKGGYYSLASGTTWGLVRCHSYSDRPAQADMLHVDLWSAGRPITGDSGTYSYCCEPPWDRYFASTAAHNTVEVDGADQMDRGPRFLWFDWTQSKLRHVYTGPDDAVAYWEGQHAGYERGRHPVLHRRAVLAWEGCWVIVDDLLGAGPHEFTLRWQLGDGPWQQRLAGFEGRAEGSEWTVRVHSPGATIRLLRGQELPRPEGWMARHYGERTPRAVLRAAVMAVPPVRFVTLIHRAGLEHACELQPDRVRLPGPPVRFFRLAPPAQESVRIVEEL